MFDISLAEIGIIALVALLIIGPQKLPEVARTIGYWLGKVRRMVASAKSDMDREFKTDELRNLLTQQKGEMQELRKILDETRTDMEVDTSQLGVNLQDNVLADSPGDQPATTEPELPAAIPAESAPQKPPHDGSK